MFLEPFFSLEINIWLFQFQSFIFFSTLILFVAGISS